MPSVRKGYEQLAPVVDLLSATAALAAALVTTSLYKMPHGVALFLGIRVTVKNLLLLGFVLAAWHVVFLCFRLYERGDIEPIRRWRRVLLASTVAVIPVLPYIPTSMARSFGLANLALFWTGTVILMMLSRLAYALFVFITRDRTMRQCLIVGSGQQAFQLYNSLQNESRYEVMGFIDDLGPHTYGPEVAARILGSIDDLENIVSRMAIDELLVGLPVKSCYSQIQRVIEICEVVGVQCKIPSLNFSCSLARPEVTDSEGTLITLAVVTHDFRHTLKRVLDVIGAAVGLVAFSPVLLGLAVAIKFTSPGPVLFSQLRYGLNRRRFRMYKFRTMVTNAESLQANLEDQNEAWGPVFKIKQDPRVTRLGQFLRRASLDELPQLWNVLEGDMSLVGPRPLPERDVARFADTWLMRRFSVKPGLTCLWQISGRSNISFDRWIELDLEYIDKWSLALDLKILARTMSVVVKGSGAV